MTFYGRELRRLLAVLATALFAVSLIVASGGTASAAGPDEHRMATWNMQQGSDKWDGVATLARRYDVVALQEVPDAPPAGHVVRLGRRDGITTYRWEFGRGDQAVVRYLHILEQPSRSLGMVTAWNPQQSDVLDIDGRYRDALGIIDRSTGVLFASIHASARGGGDAPALVRRVAAAATHHRAPNYAVLGDFNREPADLLPDLPGDANIYNSDQATQRDGGELDYLVSNVQTTEWPATVDDNSTSDHWPVHFGSLRAGAVDVAISTDNNSGHWLDVERASTANGTHVISYHGTGGTNQLWRVIPNGRDLLTGQALSRIVSVPSRKCLDVDNGQHSGVEDYLNIWDCHGSTGQPLPGGRSHDTQNFILAHPNPRMPNETMIVDNATHLFANISRNDPFDGAWVIQWPYQTEDGHPVINETFHLHPKQ